MNSRAIRQPGEARRAGHDQRGAATLIVVMILFFVISMVAAYTSRNLIFEQRTSANQYRATQAFEAADAGIEWAVAQLNAGRMTDACTASADTSVTTTELPFRVRYLNVDAGTGNVTRRTASGGGGVNPRCTFDGSSSNSANWGWSCYCPRQNQASTPTAPPVQTGPAPAFLLRFQPVSGRSDLVRLESTACTRNDSSCLSFASTGTTGDGISAVAATIALRSALNRIPSAPLTVSGNLSAVPSGAALSVDNAASSASGVTIHAGGSVPTPGGSITLTGLPGTPPTETLVQGDAALTPVAASAPTGYATVSAADRRFTTFFGMAASTYKSQPGQPVIDCSSACTASDINDTLRRNPGRAIWVAGNAGTLAINANIGSDAEPVLIITDGQVAVSDGVTIRGLVYGRNPTWIWTVAGSATVLGAVVGEGSFSLAGGTANLALSYRSDILRTLRLGYGTFVRAPGSWRDFPLPVSP